MAAADHELSRILWLDARQAAAVRAWADSGERLQTAGLAARSLASSEHILRRDQAAAGDQHGRNRNADARFGKARQDQKRGREQWRRVGRSAQHADVAALHPDIPGVERGSN